VWWSDVCEDGVTFTQESGTSYINGGGAFNADDKVMQHNGGGTVAVKNFYGKNIGKLYRSCGNCEDTYARTSTFDNVLVEGGDTIAGINGNFGGTYTFWSSPIPYRMVMAESATLTPHQTEPPSPIPAS